MFVFVFVCVIDNCFISFSTIDADPFTAKLFNIYETIYKEGFSQVKY